MPNIRHAKTTVAIVISHQQRGGDFYPVIVAISNQLAIAQIHSPPAKTCDI
jgi:hypothetical protein